MSFRGSVVGTLWLVVGGWTARMLSLSLSSLVLVEHFLLLFSWPRAVVHAKATPRLSLGHNLADKTLKIWHTRFLSPRPTLT